MKKIVSTTIIFAALLVVCYSAVYFIEPGAVVELYLQPDNKIIWAQIKPFDIGPNIAQSENYKDDLMWSPNSKRAAFFEHINEPAEKLFSREWAIKVIDPGKFRIKTIFVGTYKTSFYKWLDDQTIRVYVNAGTGVRIYRDIDVNIPEPFAAAEHETPEYWTPEKTI